MKHDFTPWIDTIGRPRFAQRSREFFRIIFANLTELGFHLANPDALAGGYRLEFKRGSCWVIADRYMSFHVAGETPGIQLYDESESWEASFHSYTPVSIVTAAILALSTDE